MKRGRIIAGLSVLMLLLLYSSATNTVFARSFLNKGSEVVHPVHVSYTTIEYYKDTGKFRILFRIFVDDFDLILKNKYGKELKLSEGRWENSNLKIINSYILEHFKLIIDGKDKTDKLLKYTSHDVKEQAIWLYYDYSYDGKVAKFDIYNSLMTDLYPDQNNLLIFTYNKKQLAYKFDAKKTNEEISF